MIVAIFALCVAAVVLGVAVSHFLFLLLVAALVLILVEGVRR